MRLPTKNPHRVRRLSEDRVRREHGGYLESPAKLLKAYEAGIERTRLRLEQQREQLQHLAKIRGAGPPASSGLVQSAEGPPGRVT
jgi:hypothetical protein